MPIAWRYLITHFVKTTLFCVLGFVALLLTMRLDEIAHFTALGASFSHVLLFTFYQIPYILPIALPISCLIASYTLVKRLSGTHELTALRASGFGLKEILAPLLVTTAFFALINFYIVSELATKSHLTNNMLKNELRAVNPLLLLNNKHLMRLRGIYFESLGPSRYGEMASDVVFAMPNTHQERLNLMIAKNLKTAPTVFIGQGMTVVTSLDGKDDDQFDHLFIENMEETVTNVEDFGQLLQRKVWNINNDYLKMSLLLVRMKEYKKALDQTKDLAQRKQIRAQIGKTISEILRRSSLALAVFSFTLMGAAFGMNIGRQRSYLKLYAAILLTALFLGSFFMAKGGEQRWYLSAAMYLIPNFLIIAASLIAFRRISRGLEV